MVQPTSAVFATAFPEEIATVLRADTAAIVEAPHPWRIVWQHQRHGTRPLGDALPRTLLGEVLDRQAGASRPASASAPSLLAACLSFTERPNRVLLAVRPRDSFTVAELHYSLAAGHYLGAGLERAAHHDALVDQKERLDALLMIAGQLIEQRETVPLLELIAQQANRLLHCERSSIFLWDRARKELVGRPALGLPGGELRIPDDRGIVGKTVQTGQVHMVEDTQKDPTWNPEVDAGSGFKTRNLLCVPLRDKSGQCLGAFEVLNKSPGSFSPGDVETLQALTAHIAIGDLSAGGQAKLLRVLEDKIISRVGSSKPIVVEMRIVAATNRNLADFVRAGKFREDLYYRLTVVTLDLPALRSFVI